MKPPDEFFEEYEQMRERMEWARSSLGRGHDLAQGKTFLEEFRHFHEKWYPVITDSEIREGMDAASAALEQTVGRGLEKTFLNQLHEVIDARMDWQVGELLLKTSVNFIGLMKEAPPELRPGLEKIYRDSMGMDFDPATEFRDAEAGASEHEETYRKALATLEVDWPERIDAALCQRLEHLDGPAAEAWRAELDAQLEKLDKQP